MSGPTKKVVDAAFKASKNIDWDGMAKLLVSDEARKEFASLRRAFNELVELKEAEEKSLKESERLEEEVAEVQELKKKISTMTADEYFEKHPELKKKFDDEIRNDEWGY